MNNSKFNTALLPLIFALPTFTAGATDTSKEALQQQLTEIQARLAQLEQTKPNVSNGTSLNLYGSLRPTFGLTSSDDEDSWDVGDALSRIGLKAQHKLSNNTTGFAKAEFKVQIGEDSHFGDARLAYVGVKGNFGRLAVGMQNTTQFATIAGPVDIFNRSSTPLAYDDVGPFRQQEMVTYRKQMGNLEFRVEGQFRGGSPTEGSDMFATGVNYSGDDFYAALAYRTVDVTGTDVNTIGVSGSMTFGDLYLAGAYQDIDDETTGADGLGGKTRSTLDLAAAYRFNNEYKLKLGLSTFDDDAITSGDVTRFNTTLEWQGSPDYRLFVEYQNNNFKTESSKYQDNNQLMVGLRYDFDYKF